MEKRTRQPARSKLPKGEKVRIISLPASYADLLRAHKITQAEQLLRLGVRQSKDTYVCTTAIGTIPAPESLTTNFVKYLARHGFPKVIHFHTLRHSHATLMLQAGIHPRIAQERLGHASIAITLDLYSHVTPTMQEEAAKKLDEALK
jgi:integrase